MKILTFFLTFFILTQSAFAAISTQTVWEVRQAGNDTNGGGFVAGESGTDYSQQDAKNTTGSNISTTDAVANGTTTITSATASFTSAIVGNVIYLAGGSGSLTAGWYQVTAYTDATTITVDRSVSAGTGITMNIGGALGSLAGANSAMVSRNKIYIKADAVYTTATGYTMSVSGGVNPTNQYNQIIGYGTTRGDGVSATLKATAGSITVLSTSSNSWRFANLIIDCDNQTTCNGIYLSGMALVYGVTVQNYTQYGLNTASSNPSKMIVAYSEFKNGGSGSIGIRMNGNGVYAMYNYVHDSAGTGIQMADTSTMSGNIVANISGASSDCINPAGNYSVVTNNTVYNCGRHGVRFSQGINTFFVFQNNIISTTGSCGATFPSAGTPAIPTMDGNGFYSTAGGARCNMDDTGAVNALNAVAPYTNVNDVVFLYDPFVDAASGNFALTAVGGGGGSARAAGVPKNWKGYSYSNYLDMGAVQSQPGAGVVGSYVFGE